MATKVCVKIGLGNGLSPNGTKLLPQPMLTLGFGIHPSAPDKNYHSKSKLLQMFMHLPGTMSLLRCRKTFRLRNWLLTLSFQRLKGTTAVLLRRCVSNFRMIGEF